MIIRISCALFVLFLFISINIAADISSPDNRLKANDGLATYWLAKAYLCGSKSPEIVILGNSQLGSLLGADSYVYHRVVDITDNHRSYVLEHDLKILLNKDWQVFVSALPGALVSDQLIISRTLFSGVNKPKLVALSLTPRDFVDNMCKSDISTEPFIFFSNCPDLRKNLDSLDICRKAKYKFKPNDYNCFDQTSTLSPSIPFQRISPCELTIDRNQGYSFIDNRDEYRRRYKLAHSEQFSKQISCLEDLLSYLAQQNIKALVFSLPLTDDNNNLLPNQFRLSFNELIPQVCAKTGAVWIDFNSDRKAFPKNYFIDTAQLNLLGGLQLSRAIAFRVADQFHLVDFDELINREKKIF